MHERENSYRRGKIRNVTKLNADQDEYVEGNRRSLPRRLLPEEGIRLHMNRFTEKSVEILLSANNGNDLQGH